MGKGGYVSEKENGMGGIIKGAVLSFNENGKGSSKERNGYVHKIGLRRGKLERRFVCCLRIT